MEGPAWRLAHTAAQRASVWLRPLTTLEDADAILRVMIATWNEGMPRGMIRALADSGNVPWGAVDEDELIAFVLGWAAVSPEDGLHEHSHMLAALPDRRHAGVGYALKLAQRASCLDRGIPLVRWTFDPLVARNANLNIAKLGATCDRFHRDLYGEMPDAINAGDRSDRLVVRWRLEAEPATPPIPHPARLAVRSTGPVEAPRPEVDEGAARDAAVVAIQVPRDHAALRTADPTLGAHWREVVGSALEACIGRGLAVVAFDPGLDHGRPVYYLAPDAAR